MNEAEISRYITDTFESVDVVVDSGNSFFFYNPVGSLPPDYRLMFVTLMTRDDVYDQFSNLNRPSVFRLNIGITKQTFRTLFPLSKPPVNKDSAGESSDDFNSYDFTVLDQVIPNPVYGRMYWVCVLNPSNDTFKAKIRPLLTEAHKLAVSKYKR